MRLRFVILMSVFCMLTGFLCHANDDVIHLPINQISTDNGLSHTTVHSIYRDEFGFVWVGTTDGLNRYDGHSVTVYRYDSSDDNSIKANNISEICGDRNGHIYIRGQKSLIQFDLCKEAFKTVHNEGISAITYHDGLYYASDNRVYKILNDGSEELIYTCSDRREVRQIRFDANNNLVILTGSDLIIRIAPDGSSSEYQLENIYAIDCDPSGNTWICTRTSGFACIDRKGQIETYTFKGNSRQAADRNNVRSIVHARGTHYYIGTYDGLILYDVSTNEVKVLTYDLSKGFKNHAVRMLYKDENLLFIGTYHAGFQYYNTEERFQKAFAPAFHHGALSSPIISAVCKDNRGILWIGSISGGLTVMDPEKKIAQQLHKRIDSCRMLYNIKSMHYDAQEDVLWIATFSEGIVRIGISDNSFNEIPLKSPIQNIAKIIELDRNRLILCSTIDGLYSLNRNSYSISSLKDNFGLNNIGVINDIALQGNNLWLCTDYEIHKIDINQARITHSYSTDGFPGMLGEHTARCIYSSKNGDIWVGTSGAGVYRYDQAHDSFVSCISGDYKGNNFINNITEGYLSDDRLYFSTNDGISILNRQSHNIEVINRTSILPLSITDFVYVSADSTIYCTGMEGLYSANEDILSKGNNKRNRFIITGLRINNQRVSPDNAESSPLSSSTLFQKSITLENSTSSIAFEIANTSLDPTSNLSFEYKLEGFDNDYIRAYNNTISYTNLTPGSYTLKIRPLGATDDVEHMHIEILPPIYARWWFILIVFVVAGVVIYLATTHYINKRQLNKKLKEAEREKEITQAKVDFFANVSHEFRTPLTLINSYLEVMLLSNNILPEHYKNINGALANTTKLKEMINEFIDASKSDGQIRLNMTYSSVQSFVYEYYTVFSDYAQQKKIKLEFVSTINENTTIAFDRIHIGRALSNLITNAFKYTCADGVIKFEVTQDEKYIHICVEDNGKGIKKDDLSNVFQRFWQDKDANEGLMSKGSGIGLSYVKTVVEMHNGKVAVSSVPGISTRFTISLPIINSLCAYVPPFSHILDKDDSINFDNDSILITEDRSNIMIIEDNDELRNLLQRIFSRQFNVITAQDGSIALSLVEDNQIDLVISDVMMPNMSGIEFCNILKSQPSTSHIPVILLTAINAEGSIIKGLNTGADDYIVKPFSAKILLAKCHNILAIRQQLQQKYQTSTESDVNILTESTIDNDILQRAIQIIESNISAPTFDIIDFAQELGLSRTSLFNKIKSLTGMTPNNFMIDIKLKHAATLLKRGNENVSNIAYSCGFNTLSHFNKLFKKTYGMTPSEYRNSIKS